MPNDSAIEASNDQTGAQFKVPLAKQGLFCVMVPPGNYNVRPIISVMVLGKKIQESCRKG